MNGEPVDIDAVIADLEAKRATIDNAIQALRTLYGADGAIVSAVIGGAAAPIRGIEPERIPVDAFFGMRSIGDAARKYLSLVKRKQTTKQIVDALEKGGFPHQSKNFFNTVYTTLQRDERREGGEVIRIGPEWALAAWFPSHARKPKADPVARLKKLPKAKRLKAIKRALASVDTGKDAKALTEGKES
jgi:hypothetical protein